MEKILYIDGRHDGCRIIAKQISENEFVFLNSWDKWESKLPDGVEFTDNTDFTVVITHLNELNPPPEEE